MSWRARARTPRGQLQLLVALLGVAAVASLGLGFLRPWLASWMRERYPQAREGAIRAADAAALWSGSVAALRSLEAEDFDGVYRLYMRQDPEVAGAVDGRRGDELPPAPSGPLLEPGPLGRLLFAADPSRASALLRRTLVAGSPPQRVRALALCAEVRECPPLTELLAWAAERAARLEDPQAELLASTLAGLRARSAE